jgi:hypothetical protein
VNARATTGFYFLSVICLCFAVAEVKAKVNHLGKRQTLFIPQVAQVFRLGIRIPLTNPNKVHH